MGSKWPSRMFKQFLRMLERFSVLIKGTDQDVNRVSKVVFINILVKSCYFVGEFYQQRRILNL